MNLAEGNEENKKKYNVSSLLVILLKLDTWVQVKPQNQQEDE